MSDTKHKAKKKKPLVTVKPPRAIVPPKAGPLFSRPMASSPTQRAKRRAARAAGRITAKADGAEGEIELFGTIGADFWGEGVTALAFKKELESLGDVSTIHLTANSGGGDVFEATAIYNLLVQHDAEVIVSIVGVAASAMTLIAMAGDQIHIAENAHFMIHRASGLAYGNADEMRQYLKLLDNADEMIRLTYERRTGLSDGELVDLMDHDNWMTATEALDLGFVDVIDEAKTVKPHISPAKAGNQAKPVTLSIERLAAMAESLQSLRIAASANHTGDSPQTATPPISKEPKKMNAKLRAKCIAAGMAETLTGDAADKWLDDNFDKVMAPTGAVATPDRDRAPGVSDAAALDAVLDAREKRQAEATAAFQSDVDARLALAFGENVPAGLKLECYALRAQGAEAIQAKILEAKKATNINTGGLRFTESQPRDKHVAAIKAGLQVRALAGLADKHLPASERPKDYERFAQMPLLRLAEQCLLVDGFSRESIDRLSGPQVAMAALGFHENAGIRADAGLHTTGSLLEVTKDAMNKSLTSAYQEAPQTWRGPFRQASSVPDFKEKHVISLSALGNLPAWVDGNAPEQGKLSNEREHYAVEARAQTVSFSWKLLVNDDMDALSRTPQLLGNAAARTVNAVVWRELTSNPTLVDGQALFLENATGNRKRSNLTTGSASPTNTTITAMRTKMRLMRGLNTPEGNESEDILNLTPSYILFPAALEGLITQQIGSEADPAASGNAGILNLTRYWGLTPVCEPLLDASSTTAWYIAASPSMIDTIELSFLSGQETPVTFQHMDPKTMSQDFTIVQTYAAKAINHRGLQKHNGA